MYFYFLFLFFVGGGCEGKKGNGDLLDLYRRGGGGVGGLRTYHEVMPSVYCIFFICLLYKNGVVYMIRLEWAD